MKKVISLLPGLILLGLIAWGLIEGASLYFSLIRSLDKQVGAAIIAASTTILVSVLSVILARYYENKRLIEKDIRDKKIVVYEKLITYFFKIIAAKDKSTVQSPEDFFIEFSPSFITWGSDEVIKLWSDFRKVAPGNNTLATLDIFEKILLTIRKDIGHENKGIDKNQVLLGTFINDLESLYPKK